MTVNRAGLVAAIAAQRLSDIEKAVAGGNEEARELVSYFVGQGVGLVEAERSCRQVVQDFREEFAEAVLGLTSMLE